MLGRGGNPTRMASLEFVMDVEKTAVMSVSSKLRMGFSAAG